MPNGRIRLVLEVSQYIRRVSRELFLAAAGVPIYALPLDDSEGDVSLLDDLDDTSDLYRWANAVLGFMRLIHGVLEQAEFVDEDYLLEE